MSIKTKAIAVFAALAICATSGVVLEAGPASAGTPSCGHFCYNLSNKNPGSHFVLDVMSQAEKTGQPIILFTKSNSDPAQDWVVSDQGLVSDFFSAGMVSAQLNLHYSHMEAYEVEYAPYGVDSGLCVGVASIAFQGENVSLQPCGVGSRTVWVEDTADNTVYYHYYPMINGSDTNFSHPFVATYPASAYPTDKPRPQLTVTELTGSAQTGSPSLPVIGTVNSNQLWKAYPGVS